jgi:hypothetical protein
MTSQESRGPGLSLLRTVAIQDANVLRATRTVSTREQFMDSLGVEGAPPADQPNSIRSLPLDRRAEPLAALALRINRLPHVDRFGMNRQFLDAFNEIPEQNRTPDLTALASVAAYSASTFVTPATAARQGANARHTARFYNIQDQQLIFNIENASVISRMPGSAGQRVMSGENVGNVARELGFTTEAGISRLEIEAVDNYRAQGSARQKVLSGEKVNAVAKASGFATQAGISSLESAAAGSTEPQSAGQRVRNGEKVNAVAKALGFTTQAGISSLENVAAGSTEPHSAGYRVLRGERVDTVAIDSGFTTQAGIISLERAAAGSREPQSAGLRVASGEHVGNVAIGSGFTTQLGRLDLETRAAYSPHDSGARRAMINGATVAEVVERFGFTTPDIIQALQRFYTTHAVPQNQVAAAQGGA